MILNIFIFLVLGIGFLFLKKYLPSYFSEKGKNLATKEDIEEITEKVKTVESKINILTGNIIDYSSLKRQYIIDYFASYNNWERTITSSNLDYSEECKKLNDVSIERMYNAKHNYNLKEGEIELFIEDNEFYTARKKLTIKTLEYQHEFERVSIDLYHLFSRKSTNNTHREDLMKLLSDYRKNRVDELKEIYKERSKLIEKLSVYIKEMME